MLIVSNFALFSIFSQLLKFNVFLPCKTIFIGVGIKCRIKRGREDERERRREKTSIKYKTSRHVILTGKTVKTR